MSQQSLVQAKTKAGPTYAQKSTWGELSHVTKSKLLFFQSNFL